MEKISPEHLDALSELDNITLGLSAIRLEKATGIPVKMIKPKAVGSSLSEAVHKIPVENRVSLIFKYSGDCEGEMAFIFSRDDLSRLVQALVSQGKADSFDTGLRIVGREIGEGINEGMSTLIPQSELSCSVKEIIEGDPAFEEEDVVFIEGQFLLEKGDIKSHFWHLIPVSLGNSLASTMLGEIDSQLKEFEKKARQDVAKEDHKKEEIISDVPDIMIEIGVRLAHKRLLFRELWEINPGETIEFPQYVSQPVDVVYKNKVIAKGQIVVVGEKFGVRVTEVQDYVKNIGG